MAKLYTQHVLKEQPRLQIQGLSGSKTTYDARSSPETAGHAAETRNSSLR